MRVAVVGGGPGGLMSALLLERTLGSHCRVPLADGDSQTPRIAGCGAVTSSCSPARKSDSPA